MDRVYGGDFAQFCAIGLIVAADGKRVLEVPPQSTASTGRTRVSRRYEGPDPDGVRLKSFEVKQS